MPRKRRSSYLVIVCVLLALLPGVVLAVPPVQEGLDHVVQPGETLAAIAQRFLGDAGRYPEIVAATNNKHVSDASYALITDPETLEVGWRLFIPEEGAGPVSSPASTSQATAQPLVVPVGETTDIARGKIAFSLYNPGREVYEVQIVTADGKDRWIVTDEQAISEPVLSPDGARIAVRGWDRYRGIQSFDLYGQNQASVSGHHEDSKPDWGEGGAIVLGSQRESDRRWRLYEGGSDTEWKFTNRDNLIESVFGEDPAWSPGDRFVVYRGCDPDLNRCGLRTVERGGSQPQILTVEGSDTSPDWSPDGAEILFMSRRAGNWDLFTLAVDGEGRAVPGMQPAPLTNALSNEMLPVWSPWGDAIAYVSDQSGAWAVYIMRPDGSDVRKVTDIGGNYDPPLWAPEINGRGVTDEQISWSQ